MKKILNATSEFSIGDLRVHRRLCRTVAGISSFLMLATFSAPAFAAGTSVLGGDATLTGATRAALNTGSATDTYAQFVANAGAKSAVLDWSKFNIGAGKEMNFNGAGTTFFNLVDGAASKSQIDGLISGNGSVWVINPNGIAFGANSQVNVGGIFAAAAGNLSNADQLRDGTSTLPTFSSFAGEVSSVSGTKFTADQVALMGKTVSAADADFSGAGNLAMGAASSLVVDEVAGGKVTINLETFVEKTADELELGSLNVVEEVRVVTDGALRANGDIEAGSVYLKSGSDQTIAANIHATAGNLQLLTQNGDLTVNDGVTVRASGEGTTLQLQSAQNALVYDENWNIVSPEGDVNVNGNLLHEGEDSTTLVLSGYNGIGDVHLKGSLESTGDVYVQADFGGITIDKGARVETFGDGRVIQMRSGLSYGSSGGDINVAGDVKATGAGSNIEIDSGYYYFANGNLRVSGNVAAIGEGGTVTLAQGNRYGSVQGELDVSGSVVADGAITIASYDGDVVFGSGSKVNAGGDVILSGAVVQENPTESLGDTTASVQSGGKIYFDGGVRIAAGNAAVSAKEGVLGFGTLDARNSVLSISTENGDISFDADYGAKIFSGKISFAAENGNVTANNVLNKIDGIREITVSDDGTADVKAQNIVNVSGSTTGYVDYELQDGTILVDGDLISNGPIILMTENGDVYVMKGCAVETRDEGAYIYMDASSDLTIAGKLVGSDSIDVYANHDIALAADASVDAQGSVLLSADADMDGSGRIDTAARIRSAAGGISLMGAEIKVPTGTIEAWQDVSVQTTSGNISIGVNGQVVSDGGKVNLLSGYGAGSSANIVIDGNVTARSETGEVFVQTAMSEGSQGDVLVNGAVSGGNLTMIRTDAVETSNGGAVTVNGRVSSDQSVLLETKQGDVSVNGSVGASDAMISSGGDVRFSDKGSMNGKSAMIVAKGNLTQDDASLQHGDGRVDSASLRPAVSGDEIVLEIGGSIGNGMSNPFVVDGKNWAISFGDMSLAAGNGHSLQGGNASSVSAARDSAQYAISSARKMIDGTLTLEESLARAAMLADFDDNALLYAAGDMFLYTAGQLEANSYIGSGKDMTVSAATFGDMSYLQAGGFLTINNVGKPAYPQIAYFETVNGVEPTINNQPNDTVIFVDGRLAGGNLKILNQFGANEAFLVQTPELKSTQGIFGNPTFLHSDLDVANPMEVSAIDYMLQETPRLTLDKDFPAEVDSHVDSVVVPERDSIQFGRDAKNEAPTEAAEEKVATTPSADGRVAMLK